MNTPTTQPTQPTQPLVPSEQQPSDNAQQPRSGGHNQTLGSHGEALAESYLVTLGFQPIARNWRCKYGELDLLMRDGSAIVAIEVKTRSGNGFGSALEAITMRKAARLRRLLLEWAAETGNRGALLRVDAVGITMQAPGTPPRIDHLRAIS